MFVFRRNFASAWIAIFILGQCVAAFAADKHVVSIELVIAVDASISVNDDEFALQVRGIADALRRPEISALIEQHNNGVAVALVQWSGWAVSRPTPPWRLLTNRESALRYADEIDALQRVPVGYLTGIGSAIDFAVDLLNDNAYQGKQQKIDISGDGRNNTGPTLEKARKRAFSQGITINGLAILTDDPGLHRYYKKYVIVGPASFVIGAQTYSDFALAMAKKFVRELSILTARNQLFRPQQF